MAHSGEFVDPTYPDRRVTVGEAEAATAAVVTGFFSEIVPAWKAEFSEWEALAAEAKEQEKDPPARPVPVSWGARVETAIGKTELAIAGAAEAAKAGISVVYAAPMHSLLAELAERFRARGVETMVYRGYTNPDPDASGQAMCLDIPAMEDARDAVRPIPSTVCERMIDKQKHYCAFYERCGMTRQRQAAAAVWLVPHALLFQARPSAIPAPDAVVIDEGVTMGALPDQPSRMSLDAIERAPVDPADDAPIFTNSANDLDAARGNLLRALRDHDEDGPLLRSILIRHGVTAAVAGEAHANEWKRLRDPGITPGMDAKTRKACAGAVGAHNQDVKGLAGIWKELRALLASDAPASGRLSLRYDEKTGARNVERRSLDTVKSSWSAPTLLIDATLPDPALLEPVIGHPVEIRADISARWSPHVRVRQILGAPVTAQKLGIVEDKEPDVPRRVVTDLLRLIQIRAAVAFPRIVVVIAPKRLIGRLTATGLPENVETAHFGAVAGIDKWSTAAGLVCIGRLQPGPGTVEPLAGIVSGTVSEAIPASAEGGRRWYRRGKGAIRMADGRGVPVEYAQHPSATAEALRWQITEAGVIQAIGRLRALRRQADAPAFLDIINDVPLPISVDTAATWEDAKPGAWADMAPEGVLLESAADIMACFPEAAPTRDRAREISLPTLGVTSIDYLSKDVTPSVKRATYKRLGRFAPARAVLLPNAPADLKSWLSERLGAIEWVKIEEPQPRKEAMPPHTPARLRPSTDYDPALVARFACIAQGEPAPFQPAPVLPEFCRFDPDAPIRFPPFARAILDQRPAPEPQPGRETGSGGRSRLRLVHSEHAA